MQEIRYFSKYSVKKDILINNYPEKDILLNKR